MTAPRQVLPCASYLVTRRCAQRQFLLAPSEATNEIFGYVLAVAAHRFGMLVHAFCVLSNHFHLVVTDPGAQLPAFSQYLDSLVARAMNASLGRWESFWAPQSYSAVALASREDVVAKIAYVLANPVAARLVRRGREWRGLWSPPASMGDGEMRFHRPDGFFRARGCMPEAATLALSVPAGFDSPADFQKSVAAALQELEERCAPSDGLAVRDPVETRDSPAVGQARHPSGGEPRRALNPRVAARDKWKRVEVLARLVTFLRSYREAWIARRAGNTAAVFPAGTYLLRVQHGVACAAPH